MTPTVVPAIFRAKDEMSKTIARMQSNTGSFAKQFSNQFAAAGKTAFKFGRSMAITGLAIAAPLVIAAKTAIDFEEKMSNVSTLIDTSKESIASMGDEVLKLAMKLPVPIDELTTSLYDIRSAGITAEKQFETLESAAKLSAAGLSSVSDATNISTSALNAFRLEGLSAAETNDILFKTVKFGKTTITELAQGFGSTAPIIQSAGVKLADFSAATAALTTLGTPASQAQNQLAGAIGSLKKPTAEMEKIFKSLGVTTDVELIKKFGTLGGAFEAVQNKGAETGVNLAKAWGKKEAMSAVISLTTSTKDAYLTAMDDMVNGANSLDEAFAKQSKTGKSSLQLLKNNMQSLSITVGQALLPVINDLVKAVMPYIKSMADWIGRNKALTGTIVKVAAGIAAFALAMSGAAFVVGVVQKALVVAKFAVMAFNMAMAISPLGAVIALAAGLSLGLYALSGAFSNVSKAQQLDNETRERALDKTLDQRVEVTRLFNDLRKLKVGTQEYTDTLAKVEKMQPGITEKYKLQAEAVRDLDGAEKALISTIMARATAEVNAEMVKERIREGMQAQERQTGAIEGQIQGYLKFLTGKDVSIKDIEAKGKFREAEVLASRQGGLDEKAANPNAETNKPNQKIDLVINGQNVGTLDNLFGKQTEVSGPMMPSMPTNR